MGATDCWFQTAHTLCFEVSPWLSTALDVDTLIGEALALVRDDLQTHRIAVQADRKERLPRIKGDQVQLQQVLVNLVTNAIDSMATKDGERVLCVRSEVDDCGV